MLNVKEMSKKAKAIALGVGVAALLTAAGMLAFSGPAPKVLVEGDYIEAQSLGSGDSLGSSVNTRVDANGGTYEILPEKLYTGEVWVTSTLQGAQILVTEK